MAKPKSCLFVASRMCLTCLLLCRIHFGRFVSSLSIRMKQAAAQSPSDEQRGLWNPLRDNDKHTTTVSRAFALPRRR